jgi:hypothetical protein
MYITPSTATKALTVSIPISLVLLFASAEAHAGLRSRVPPCESGCGSIPEPQLGKAQRSSALAAKAAALQERIVAQRIASGQLAPQAMAQPQKRVQPAAR